MGADTEGGRVTGSDAIDGQGMPRVPGWVPDQINWYLGHTVLGRSIRAIARRSGNHPSTVMRAIRKCEIRRDDPLFDAALNTLGQGLFDPEPSEDPKTMTAPIRHKTSRADDKTVAREARRILRRLCEGGAFLAIAQDLEQATVLKEDTKGEVTRIAVVARDVVEAFVLKDWITRARVGRVTTYRITTAGRAALKRMLSDEKDKTAGFAEAPARFGDQHREWGIRAIREEGEDTPRKLRCNLAESPLALLARRRDKDGQPFLSPELVMAGERLREDFELAQMGPRITQNWDKFLTAGARGGFVGGGPGEGPGNARDRVAAALKDLGPGLGDVVLRCCCFLEGMEVAEKRMGWSARSGKIVLRIALQRLKKHYDDLSDPRANMIG